MSKLSSITILSTLILAFFFVFVVVVASTTSFSGTNNGEVLVTSQREFDYFALSLQWPGTYCQRTRKCCKDNACCRRGGPPKHFTIHGLWPDYNDGGWPACCTNSEFDIKEISTLRKALDEYWPSLSCGSPTGCNGHKGSFWAHEWGKHGTCAASVTGDEYNYFLTTLNVYFKYNLTEALGEAGYVPSNSDKYPLGGIISAIENAFHTSPLVVCSHDAIQEIRLCFYKDFKPRDCVITAGIKEKAEFSKSSCPKYVSLPIYESLGLKEGITFSQSQPDVEAL